MNEAVNSGDNVTAVDSVPAANPSTSASSTSLTYRIVDSNQAACYDNNQLVPCPEQGSAFAGQDGNYQGAVASYQNNGDGTVSDLVTGLMWSQSADLNGDGTINASDKLSYTNAMNGADSSTLAGYDDWRLPTIKELYSLILFDGTDVSACPGGSCSATPFIDTRYFGYAYGDTSAGERVIDAQFATSTKYVSTTMNGDETMFGVNFADGRIKGYGLSMRGTDKTFFVLYVRGGNNYGVNAFADNGNGTVTDNATGLTWMQGDSGTGMNWESALNYCEAYSAAGSDDWRLPSVKELQSILDYSRSPATTNSPAIDPIFASTAITAENGSTDYPFYWSSTTHASSNGGANFAAYVSFGSAYGYMTGPNGGTAQLMDVHGAGAQRSDPKTGSASEYPEGHGPQGDVVRVDNYVRCVRGGEAAYVSGNTTVTTRPSMSIQDSGTSGLQQGQGQATQLPAGSVDLAGSGNQGTSNGQQPPQAAIDACVGLTLNTACSINTPNGTVTGTCGTPPNSSQMACMPAGGPPSP
ncbi:MAG: DUF1566 domain-containing protein [Anaerolineales bacterium]|nr:DUF1566 domain-containing protein [Anaerolineales bacterium]